MSPARLHEAGKEEVQAGHSARPGGDRRVALRCACSSSAERFEGLAGLDKRAAPAWALSMTDAEITAAKSMMS